MIRLGPEEFTRLTFFLDLRDLAMLQVVGCRSLWASLASSTREARLTTTYVHFQLIAMKNPFPLVSRFSSLHAVKLRAVHWKFPEVQQSPFLGLPSTLLHLEFETTSTFIHDKQTPLCDVFLRGFDFKASFPKLATLSLSFARCVIPPSYEKDALDSTWISTLPPSLTSLTLHNAGYMVVLTRYIFGEASLEGSLWPKLGFKNGLEPASPRTHPFPNLRNLDLGDANLFIFGPLEVTLPPGLTRFCVAHQRTYFEGYAYYEPPYDVSETSNTSSIPLRNLKMIHLGAVPDSMYHSIAQYAKPVALILDHVSNPNLALPITSKLKKLRYLAPTYRPSSIVQADPSSLKLPLEDLYKAGARLDDVHIWSLALEGPQTFEQKNRLSSVFASLSTLRLNTLREMDLPLLPSSLTMLSLMTWSPTGPPEEEWLSRLPQGLLRFQCGDFLEIGHLPLLPRTVTDLRAMVSNRRGIGTRFLSIEQRAERDLPYDSIVGNTNVLFGLPPNLKALQLDGCMVLDSNFGLFLPRSLQSIICDDEIVLNIADVARSKVEKIGGFFGIGAIPKTPELLKRSIGFFPPSCLVILRVVTPAIISDSLIEVHWQNIARICPYWSLMAKWGSGSKNEPLF